MASPRVWQAISLNSLKTAGRCRSQTAKPHRATDRALQGPALEYLRDHERSPISMLLKGLALLVFEDGVARLKSRALTFLLDASAALADSPPSQTVSVQQSLARESVSGAVGSASEIDAAIMTASLHVALTPRAIRRSLR